MGELPGIGDGAHFGCGIQGIAQANAPLRFRKRGDKTIMQAALHQKPRPRDTGLPAAGIDRLLRALDGAGEIGIVENNIRTFAAEFEQGGHAARCGSAGNGAACGDAPHKHHLGDFRGGEQSGTGPLPWPGDHLKQAAWQPGLFGQPSKRQGS